LKIIFVLQSDASNGLGHNQNLSPASLVISSPAYLAKPIQKQGYP